MRKNKSRLGDLSGYAFISPAAVLMLIFIVYTLISSVEISFTDWRGLGDVNFIGFDNYKELIHDATFWNSLKLQFIWAALSVVVLAAVGLVLAVIVEFSLPYKRLVPIFRTVLFMPMMMSLVAVGLLWTLIFNPMIGLLNEFLKILGLLNNMQTIDILGSYDYALYGAFVPAIWQWSGFGMVIFSAAMQGIPNEIMEASIVDGCSKTKQIRYIILPLMRPTIATVCTLNLIGGFKCFDLIYAMTAGGPGISTQVTSIYIFKQVFTNSNYGYGSAMSFILFLITVIFGMIFFKFSKRMEDYV